MQEVGIERLLAKEYLPVSENQSIAHALYSPM